MMSKQQELNLELIKLASFNEFDGVKAYQTLFNNQSLWQGVVIDRDAGQKFQCDLIKLRDIEKIWNVDTLYITCTEENKEALYSLIEQLNPDELWFLDPEEARNSLGGSQLLVLRAWWD